MKKCSNDLLLNDWYELILSIYKDQYYYNKLREAKKKIYQNDGINILENPIKILKMRYIIFQNITRNEFENNTYLKNI